MQQSAGGRLNVQAPPAASFEAAALGFSAVTNLGWLRRSVIQEDRLESVRIASRECGRVATAEAAQALLGFAADCPARAFNSPFFGAWIRTAVLGFNPATSSHDQSTMARSLGQPSWSDADKWLSATVLDGRWDAHGLPGAPATYPALEVEGMSARVRFPGMELAPLLDSTELPSVGTAFCDAVDLIEAHLPEFSVKGSEYVRAITPIHKVSGRLLSATTSDLLGLVFIAADESPSLIAEQVVHETAHTALFLIQFVDDLLIEDVPGESWSDARFYSPWRRDPRPLNGVFHGVYVFTQVARFWRSVLASTGAQSERQSVARRRLGLVVAQLRMAHPILQQHAQLSSAGRAILRRLKGELEDVLEPFASDLSLDKENALDLDSKNIAAGEQSVSQFMQSHHQQWQERSLKTFAC